MTMLLEDRVAIVSGIGPGMGREIALALAREGADVVLAARTQSALDEVAEVVRAKGRRALTVPTDIAKPDDCRRLADAAQAEFGRIDVLVNNAFLSNPVGPFAAADLTDWRKMFDVNVFGALQLTQAVVTHMRPQKRGSIVFINSMSMRIIEPNVGGYAASKGALMIASQTLARELGADGIRVNSVVPGYIWSPKMEGYFHHIAKAQGTTYEAVHADITSRTSLRHIPDSAEIADTVVFFASDLSRVVTGQALDVNGGHFFH
ncbi:MAG TPA: SDR family oxidoreductase [Candidatus Binatia bacterium]|jgi:NAD(P)-dependent dehydrogenase (short-subunit alcohol dehydrogenase family)|nr:SDR family oxidoreductase [Candidatus Binatia bacterium]